MVVHSRGSVLVWCLTGTVESNMRSDMVVGSVTTRLGAVTAAVAALVAAVQDGALRGEGHDELSGLLGQVRSLQARLDYVSLTAVREVDIRGSYVADGALSAGAWARMHTRMTPGEATGVVRTARTLGSGELPATQQALADGHIDLGHVTAITAAVADAPTGAAGLIEAEALAVAGEADPRAVAALMTRFRHALDPDAADAAALGRYARRGITLSPLPDGAVHIKGLADEVTGAVLMTAIDAANPPVTGDTRTAAQQRMDALADICRKYLGSPHAPMTGGGHAHLIVALDATTLTNGHTHPDNDTASDTTSDSDNVTTSDSDGAGVSGTDAGRDGDAGPGPEPDHDSDDHDSDGHDSDDHDSDGHDSDDHDSDRDCAGQADAVGVGGAVLDWGVGLAERPPVGNVAGDATTGNGAAGIATTGNDATGTGISLGAVAGQGYGAGPGGTLSWVGPIAGSTARRVGCDADVTYVGINDQGQATIVGREQRFFSWAQRKAMIARDGDRCAVPFCDRPIAWADAHHLLDWALGGPTRISNGALPCAGHHPMCHEGGWTLIRLPDGRYLFRHRDGKTIGPEPYPPGHNRPPPHNKPPPHNPP